MCPLNVITKDFPTIEFIGSHKNIFAKKGKPWHTNIDILCYLGKKQYTAHYVSCFHSSHKLTASLKYRKAQDKFDPSFILIYLVHFLFVLSFFYCERYIYLRSTLLTNLLTVQYIIINYRIYSVAKDL